MTQTIHAVLLLAGLVLAASANGQNSIHCSLARADRDHILLSWEALPGRSYTLEGTSSLHEPWKPTGVYVAATNRLEFRLSMNSQARFFRITQKLPAASPRPYQSTPTGYAYDPRFASYFQNFTEVPERVLSINRQLREQGLLDELAPVSPFDDPRAYIAKVHTAGHIQGIQSIPIDRANGATESFGTVADLAVGYILGAVRDVCENKIRNAYCNIRPPGHHQINSGFSYGYCGYANVVIAARFALERYPDLIKKVMIVDWDYHHGNGTESFVRGDPAFLFYDTCAGGFYGGGDEARHGFMNFNSGNEGFVQEWDNEMMPLARAFKPDLILISAGFDSKKKDLMGGEGLTARGYSILTRKVMDIAEEFGGGRVVSILEGGYADIGTFNPATYHGLRECVENHVRTLMTGELQEETPFY